MWWWQESISNNGLRAPCYQKVPPPFLIKTSVLWTIVSKLAPICLHSKKRVGKQKNQEIENYSDHIIVYYHITWSCEKQNIACRVNKCFCNIFLCHLSIKYVMKRGEVGGKRGSNNTANSTSSTKENNKTLAERE